MVGLHGPHWAPAAPAPQLFIAHCPRWCFQRIQVLWRVPALSLPKWLGVRSSRLYRIRRACASEVTPSPGALRAGSHLALPGSGYFVVLRLNNPVGSGCLVWGSSTQNTQQEGGGGGVVFCLLGGWSGRLHNQLDSSIAFSCSSRGDTLGSLCAACHCGGCRGGGGALQVH